MPHPIVVPDLIHPTLCWKQAITMERCTFPKGHQGNHQWAPAEPITVLNGHADGSK